MDKRDGAAAPPNPRRSDGTRRNAARRQVAALGRPCWICGLPIDYSLPARHPLSFEADELMPVSKGGSPFDPANIAAAHRRCNQWRGDRSVEWVEEVRATVAASASWITPFEFVEMAKSAAGRARGRMRRPPRPTTEW